MGDFSALLLTVDPVPTTWTLFTVTLSGLGAGPVTGRIAFRHVVSNSSVNADFVGIDSVTVGGGCPPPPPLVMNAPTEVGEGSPNRVASVASILGATYAWTIGNGTITSGQGTNQITFTAGTAGTPLTLSVTAMVGLCPSGGGFANVTVLPPGSAVQFYTLPPCRLIDTRNPAGPLGAPALLPAPAPDRAFAIAGVCGVPADARAVFLTVTVANAQALGMAPPVPGRRRAVAGVVDHLPAGGHAGEQQRDPARLRRNRCLQGPERVGRHPGSHRGRERLLPLRPSLLD